MSVLFVEAILEQHFLDSGGGICRRCGCGRWMQLSSVDFLQAERVGNVTEMQERRRTSLLLLLVIFSRPSLGVLKTEIGSGLPSWFVLSPVERGGLQRWAAYAHSHSFRTFS